MMDRKINSEVRNVIEEACTAECKTSNNEDIGKRAYQTEFLLSPRAQKVRGCSVL